VLGVMGGTSAKSCAVGVGSFEAYRGLLSSSKLTACCIHTTFSNPRTQPPRAPAAARASWLWRRSTAEMAAASMAYSSTHAPLRWMGAWMGGCVDGWVRGWVGGWVGGWVVCGQQKTKKQQSCWAERLVVVKVNTSAISPVPHSQACPHQVGNGEV